MARAQRHARPGAARPIHQHRRRGRRRVGAHHRRVEQRHQRQQRGRARDAGARRTGMRAGVARARIARARHAGAKHQRGGEQQRRRHADVLPDLAADADDRRQETQRDDQPGVPRAATCRAIGEQQQRDPGEQRVQEQHAEGPGDRAIEDRPQPRHQRRMVIEVIARPALLKLPDGIHRDLARVVRGDRQCEPGGRQHRPRCRLPVHAQRGYRRKPATRARGHRARPQQRQRTGHRRRQHRPIQITIVGRDRDDEIGERVQQRRGRERCLQRRRARSSSPCQHQHAHADRQPRQAVVETDRRGGGHARADHRGQHIGREREAVGIRHRERRPDDPRHVGHPEAEQRQERARAMREVVARMRDDRAPPLARECAQCGTIGVEPQRTRGRKIERIDVNGIEHVACRCGGGAGLHQQRRQGHVVAGAADRHEIERLEHLRRVHALRVQHARFEAPLRRQQEREHAGGDRTGLAPRRARPDARGPPYEHRGGCRRRIGARGGRHRRGAPARARPPRRRCRHPARSRDTGCPRQRRTTPPCRRRSRSRPRCRAPGAENRRQSRATHGARRAARRRRR